jgi:hypothetical protein
LILVQEFLNQFNISNTKQTQLKQIIITVLDQAINDRLRKAQFKIIQKDGSIRKIPKLTTQLIPKTKVISLYEVFNSKELLITSLLGLDQGQNLLIFAKNLLKCRTFIRNNKVERCTAYRR